MDLNPVAILMRVSGLFLPSMNLAWLIAGLFGLYIGWKALSDAYKHVKGDQEPGMMPKGMLIPVLLLAGACTVCPVIMWEGGSVIVLGGSQTANEFSYLGQTDVANTCSNLSNALTKLCMFMGTVSVLSAAIQLYSRLSEPGRGHSFISPIIYFCGGIGLFFINDVFYLASGTVQVHIGFSAICDALDSAKSR